MIVAESEAAYFRQEWFTDSRGDVRRMRVRWHPENRLIVLSLWQGGHCTGTFRLPIEDAARMIGLYADSLAGACTAPTEPPRPSGRWWSPTAIWRNLQRRRRPPMPPLTVIRGV
jgi:hypothetical protein